MAKKKKASPAKRAAPKSGGTTVTVVGGGGGGSKKKKRASPKRKGAGGFWRGYDGIDAAIAVATALLYGYVQFKASDTKKDEYAWFKEMPIVTPVGRAGTLAGAAAGVAHIGKFRRLRGAAIGLGCVSALNIGRRGIELYSKDEGRALTAGADEGAVAGGVVNDLVMSGTVDVAFEG